MVDTPFRVSKIMLILAWRLNYGGAVITSIAVLSSASSAGLVRLRNHMAFCCLMPRQQKGSWAWPDLPLRKEVGFRANARICLCCNYYIA